MSENKGTTAAAAAHPLEPLTAEEITSAVEILQAEQNLGDNHRFAAITLYEPPKERVLNLQNGEAVERQVIATILDKSEGATYEAVVSLTEGKTTSWQHLSGMQPPFLFEEFDQCEKVCKESPEYQDALAKRGITDMDLVIIDPWSAGYYSDYTEEEGGRRLLRPLSFVRMDSDDINAYAHPIENLEVFVDMNRLEVVRVEDHGVVPVPEAQENYTPDAVGSMREDLKPIEITQPGGTSFEINGHELRWQKWRFRIGFTPQEGLVLHTVSYQDGERERSILYRASLSEMVVPYGDPAPLHSRKNAFDAGEYNIGVLANTLELGCDCLGEIRYFDAIMADGNGKPYTLRNAICVHEEDVGLLWKHYDMHTGTTEMRRSRRLVVSSVYTVANYEYGFYWYFYQDGTLEFDMKLTGIVSTGAVQPGEKPEYGQLLNEDGLYAPMHQHFFNFRLDLDVDGQENSLYEVHTEMEPPDPKRNPRANAFSAKSNLLSKESEAQQDIDPTSGRYWKVINPSSQNRVGEPVGYRLVPENSSVPPFVRPEADVMRRGKFTTKNLWATPYAEGELHAAGNYINQHPGGAGLPEWTQADRPIENEDVVLWYTFSSHHTPRLEDWPVMPVQHSGFKLEPLGFFDRNPALDVPQPSHNEHGHP